MYKLKVIDFDYGCGGFTCGLEDTKKFEVVKNFSLNDNNNYCYNKVHKNNFLQNDSFEDDFDLITFTPYLGQSFSFKGKNNFDMKELNNFLSFISLNKPENLVLITKRDSFPFLQISENVCFINGGSIPSKDIVSNLLDSIGYNVYNFIIDEAGFGLPQHVFYNIYWASLNDVDDLMINEGFGRFKQKYRTPQNLIGDLDDFSNVSWHKPNYSKKDVCSLIEPGSSAKNTPDVSQSHGYIRLLPDKVFSHLNYDFYTVSSNFPSINPWYDRPLTIREGARLYGLSDDFDWDSRLKNKVVASMICDSFYPIISRLMGLKLYSMLK